MVRCFIILLEIVVSSMKVITLLPADMYTVVNQTILTEVDRTNLISLYEPIVGPIPISLYFTLWRDLDKLSFVSKDYTHHHLMTILRCDLTTIKEAREALEAVGLLKSYYKEGEPNSYVYELYSPLSAYEFFHHPIFNVVLYNNIGKQEYEELQVLYEKYDMNLNDYTDITKTIDMTFRSSSQAPTFDVRERQALGIALTDQVDFDLLISSLPKGLVHERTFSKKTRELINNLSFLYHLDNVQLCEIVRATINEKGLIDKEEMRKLAKKYYSYNNSGSLPTLIYRTQPEYLRSPSGDTSKRGRFIQMCENTSPLDFLRTKYKGGEPTARDVKLLDNLLFQVELKPAVVNVLIDYVLLKNNNKLSQNFIETIAGQWKRLGIETAEEAMNIAEKEHKKYNKKMAVKPALQDKMPAWFDQKIEKEEASAEEIQELEDLLKEFR